jgi:hypothetical protein
MDYQLSMADLGIANDSTVLEAPSAGELVEKIVDYLRSEHDINMPDADYIMAGSGASGVVGAIGAGVGSTNPVTTSGSNPPVVGAVVSDATGGLDQEADLIVRRLRELLNLRPPTDISG